LTLLRRGIILSKPSIASAPFDDVESLLYLFSMPYCGVRNPVNAAIFFADGGDDLVPEKTIKSQEEGYSIEW